MNHVRRRVVFLQLTVIASADVLDTRQARRGRKTVRQRDKLIQRRRSEKRVDEVARWMCGVGGVTSLVTVVMVPSAKRLSRSVVEKFGVCLREDVSNLGRHGGRLQLIAQRS